MDHQDTQAGPSASFSLLTEKLPSLKYIPHIKNLKNLEVCDAQHAGFNLSAFLRACDKLESLSAKKVSLPDRYRIDLADIYLPHLRTLQLTILEDTFRMVAIFDQPRAPPLTDLKLTFNCQHRRSR